MVNNFKMIQKIYENHINIIRSMECEFVNVSAHFKSKQNVIHQWKVHGDGKWKYRTNMLQSHYEFCACECVWFGMVYVCVCVRGDGSVWTMSTFSSHEKCRCCLSRWSALYICAHRLCIRTRSVSQWTELSQFEPTTHSHLFLFRSLSLSLPRKRCLVTMPHYALHTWNFPQHKSMWQEQFLIKYTLYLSNMYTLHSVLLL